MPDIEKTTESIPQTPNEDNLGSVTVTPVTEEPKGSNPVGRPPVYSDEILLKAQEYLHNCQDEEVQVVKQSSEKYEMFDNKLKVKIPTKGGLAVALGVSRETLYAWAKEKPIFSDIMEQLGAIQEERLINNGLSGDYNPTIAKVLLTKHGYREGTDVTTNDKDMPTPLLNALPNNNSDEENSQS